MRGRGGSPERLALAVGVGLFIGALPLWGLHLPLVLLVCVPSRLDAVAAYLAAQISNPLLAPALTAAELWVGLQLVSATAPPDALRSPSHLAGALAAGALAVGTVLGTAGGLLALRWARARPAATSVVTVPDTEAALERVEARFRGASLAHRSYVTAKLLLDPVLERLATLALPRGRVFDAGAGLGQASLFLVELGWAQEVRGIDVDARRVETANRAAGDDGRFEVARLEEAVFPPVQVVLLLDVLHHLEPEQQRAVLSRAAASLAEGGVLVARSAEVDGLAAAWTRAWEWLVVACRERRRPRLGWVPPERLIAWLEAEGLQVQGLDASRGLLRNRLLVARRDAAPKARQGRAAGAAVGEETGG